LIALLVKPIHIIIEHSGRLDITAFQHEKDVLVPDHHFDCQICEFEFCIFISQKVFAIPSVQFFLISFYSILNINIKKTNKELFLLESCCNFVF